MRTSCHECQCFVERRGVYLLEKVSVFIKIRVLFWPEISALGVFLNFDNERMPPTSILRVWGLNIRRGGKEGTDQRLG